MDKQKLTIKQWWKKLKYKEVIIAVIAVIIMLLIYFSSKGVSVSVTQNKTADYCEDIQKQLCLAVSKISGDENAKVVISWSSSPEKVLAHSENSTSGGKSTNITIVQGANGSEPIITKLIYPSAIGVAVVINNANDAFVKVEIMQMIMTVLDVSSDKIGVFNSK